MGWHAGDFTKVQATLYGYSRADNSITSGIEAKGTLRRRADAELEVFPSGGGPLLNPSSTSL